MRAALGDGEPSLAEALDRYVAFYRAWSELGAVVATVPKVIAHRPSAVESTLIGAARGDIDEPTAIAALGVLSPAWDVAVPTYAERPGLIRDAIARVRSQDSLAPSWRRGGLARSEQPRTQLSRRAADLAELDDTWFARAQWMVRRALLRLGLDDDDAFWLPLDELVDHADPIDLRRGASAARRGAPSRNLANADRRRRRPRRRAAPPCTASAPGRASRGAWCGSPHSQRRSRSDEATWS